MADVPDRVWLSDGLLHKHLPQISQRFAGTVEYRRVKSCVWQWDETFSMGFGGYRYGCCDKIADAAPNYCPECGGDVETKRSE